MFYCNDCGKKNHYPESNFKSTGKCELCEHVADCNDIPSYLLPETKLIDPETGIIINKHHDNTQTKSGKVGS